MAPRLPYREFRAIGKRQSQFKSGPRWRSKKLKANTVPAHSPSRALLRAYRRESADHIAIGILHAGITEEQAQLLAPRFKPHQIKLLGTRLKPEHFDKIMGYGKKQAKTERRPGEPRGHYRARRTREIDRAVLEVIQTRELLPSANMDLIEKASGILASISKEKNRDWLREKKESFFTKKFASRFR